MNTPAAATVCVFLGEALGRYGFPAGHPYGGDRLGAFASEFQRRDLDVRVTVCDPVQADRAALLRFHTSDYVERVRALSRTGSGCLDYGNTPCFQGMYEAAATVVGTTLAAIARLMNGDCRAAFVPIAGLHHARRDGAEGFCVFNDIGVAIETLRGEYGIRRIAYVDIDAHHGDGVFYTYREDPDLYIADLHEDGHYLYPGTGMAGETGTGAGVGSKLNIPLLPGAGDADFHAAWPAVEALVARAKPEFIILQCGADSIAGDPLAHLMLSPAAHAHAARCLRALAGIHCPGRLLALGGGGYDRANLAATWCGVVEALL